MRAFAAVLLLLAASAGLVAVRAMLFTGNLLQAVLCGIVAVLFAAAAGGLWERGGK